LYPEIEIQTCDLRLNPDNAENLFKDYHVVADCTDNYKTRALIGMVSANVVKIFIQIIWNVFQVIVPKT